MSLRERKDIVKCSLLRKSEVLMLWALWMDKTTSHCVTPLEKEITEDTRNVLVVVWEQSSEKQR